MIHLRRTDPETFATLENRKRLFEILREGDDLFAVGDYLAINEFRDGRLTGDCLLFKIGYVLRDFPLLRDGVTALGLEPVPIDFEKQAKMLREKMSGLFDLPCTPVHPTLQPGRPLDKEGAGRL